MRIGMVCPYSFDVPGGVQAHVAELAQTLIDRGHQVSVLAPAREGTRLPTHVVAAGRAVPVPYNGSVARLRMGPRSAARVRRWLRTGVEGGPFDLLHVHEPFAPSLSFLACLYARGPVVATFHSAYDRSYALAAAEGVLQPVLERISGRIAVSSLARRVQVEHLAGGGVEIPNGVAVDAFATAKPLPGWDSATVGFLGRFDEPRKGFQLAATAFSAVARTHPTVRLVVAGPGNPAVASELFPAAVRDRVTFLGAVSDDDKARMLRTVDVLMVPNLRGESFGIVLTEAMAAGATVVASDLEAFRRVLTDGSGRLAGELVPPGQSGALAVAVAGLLADPARRAELVGRGSALVRALDWGAVTDQVLEMYEMVRAAAPGPVTVSERGDEGDADIGGRGVTARAERLERRCEAARANLDVQLRRRATAALALANRYPDRLGPAADQVAAAAEAALAVPEGPGEARRWRESTENDLSRALRDLPWNGGALAVADLDPLLVSAVATDQPSIDQRTTVHQPEPAASAVSAREVVEVVTAANRVRLARQIYNDAVRDAHTLSRSRRRWTRGSGNRRGIPIPRYFDVDDAVPTASWTSAS